MRLRSRTRPAALFGAMLVVGLLVFLPMRLAMGWLGLGDEGLVARQVSGTVWDATLAEARFGDLALGDVEARLSPLPLVLGRARVVLSGAGAIPLHGTIGVGRHGFSVDDLTAGVATGRVFAPVPVTRLDLDAVGVRFAEGRCESAEGRVRATLGGDVAGIVLPQQVGGPVRCDNGALLLPLVSQAGSEAITLRIEGNGRYRADLAMQGADPIAVQRLEAAGFVAGPGGYRLSIEGRL